MKFYSKIIATLRNVPKSDEKIQVIAYTYEDALYMFVARSAGNALQQQDIITTGASWLIEI